MPGAVFPRDNIDQEVEHITLSEGRCNVTTLQSPSLVVLGVDPRAHGEFCDEDVAAFCEEDGCLGGDHFDFRIGFHHLLDACERKLVDFEVVSVSLEVVDSLLPVCCENFSRRSRQALIDL